MSRYGRLWQQVQDVRERLQVLLPSASLASLAQARTAAEMHTAGVNDLLEQWAELETQMADTED